MSRSELYSSYFLGHDNIYGWGNTSYFTFFSEFNRPWPSAAYLEAAILIILFLSSTIGNIYIIVQILKNKSSRTVTNYFVCNLALADVLYTAAIPFIIAIRISGEWVLPEGMCGLVSYIMFICAFAAIWTMAVISIDRYICMNMNLTRVKRISPKQVIIISVIIWIVGCACFCPIAIFFHIKLFHLESKSVQVCTLLWPKLSNFSPSVLFTSVLCIIGFIIPLTIISVNYYRIFKKMWISKRAVAHAQKDDERIRSHSMKMRTIRSNSVSLKNVRKEKNIKIVKTLVLLVLLFLVMWMPNFIVFVLIQYDTSSETMEIPSHSLLAVIMLSYLNVCINPFLYGIINGKIKTSLYKFACCRKRKSVDLNSVSRRTLSFNNNNSTNV